MIGAMSPLYPHDCRSCEYLGTYLSYDIYVCARTHHSPYVGDCVIARYGAEGPAYYSTETTALQWGAVYPSTGTYHQAILLAMAYHGRRQFGPYNRSFDWTGRVTATPTRPRAALHREDLDVPQRTTPLTVRASTPEEAREKILDFFHRTVAIKVLDDFLIEVEELQYRDPDAPAGSSLRT